MIPQIHNLEYCWHLSSPWGQQIPPVAVSLLERVYVTTTKTFGYCCGIEWKQQGWAYEIATDNDNITVYESKIIGTGHLESLPIPKPVFRLGELAKFRFHGDGPPLRLVQGIQLITNCWFYCIEWMSPAISENCEVFRSDSAIARVSDYDLERVKL
ncbi:MULTISPECIES: DUF1392 family protein [Nostoc]|uniref:DUF1392 family protein n=2 Tax=Nostoc TaxID=1177 RepID=A0ABR8IIX0_9NOSO|nr:MULTISPECIES: DUF1392 family protein [Nostoc]MBD2565882.1 DUF1392 family protein [Nostoc linckia FACHB-391]MBD2651133.1 DUF1392 family protein [Nostoc foliaceum FACHB-393]